MAAKSRFMFEQAGVIPYRHAGDEIELLLVTSRSGNRWVFPKGHIDEGMSAPEAAAMEAYEEAGVRGSIDEESLGRYKYEKWGGSYRVTMFLMEVEKVYRTWPEQDQRTRRWSTPGNALDRLEEPRLRRLLLKALDRLEIAADYR